MRRQLQGTRPPFQARSTAVPFANGGTGQRSPEAAMAALGGIHKSQLGVTPGKLAQLDELGVLPLSLFSTGDGDAVGFSISGPKTLAYGQTAVYYITNESSYGEIPVSVSSGLVNRVEDTITIEAPSEGDYVDLTIGIRLIRIPLVQAYIEKPTILSGTGLVIEGASVMLHATPFYSEPELFGDWTAILGSNVTYTLLNPTTSFTIRGRCGETGTAFAIYEGVTYMLGKGDTDRVIRRGDSSTVVLGVTNGGELQIFEGEPLYAHTHTDWEISDSTDFTNIVWAKTVNSGDLTSTIVEEGALPAGDYFVRVRYAFRQEIQS